MSATTDATTEAVERNLDLAGDFLRGVLADPEHAPAVPAGAALVLLPADDPDGFEANLAMAAALARRGRNVYLHHVARPAEPAPTE